MLPATVGAGLASPCLCERIFLHFFKKSLENLKLLFTFVARQTQGSLDHKMHLLAPQDAHKTAPDGLFALAGMVACPYDLLALNCYFAYVVATFGYFI
jgi:hypothetical protein